MGCGLVWDKDGDKAKICEGTLGREAEVRSCWKGKRDRRVGGGIGDTWLFDDAPTETSILLSRKLFNVCTTFLQISKTVCISSLFILMLAGKVSITAPRLPSRQSGYIWAAVNVVGKLKYYHLILSCSWYQYQTAFGWLCTSVLGQLPGIGLLVWSSALGKNKKKTLGLARWLSR